MPFTNTARYATPVLASCAPFVAALLLVQASPEVRADDAADAAAFQEPLGRLSDAPWKLAKKRQPLQNRLQLELQQDTLTPRPALDFQNAPRSARMPVGTLRMALTDKSSLSFRPRSHGMHVTYREQF